MPSDEIFIYSERFMSAYAGNKAVHRLFQECKERVYERNKMYTLRMLFEDSIGKQLHILGYQPLIFQDARAKGYKWLLLFRDAEQYLFKYINYRKDIKTAFYILADDTLI